MTNKNHARPRLAATLSLSLVYFCGACISAEPEATEPLGDVTESLAALEQDGDVFLSEGESDDWHRSGTSDGQRTGGVRRSLAVGGSHACVIEEQGRVACWGHNRNGQLGDGSTTDAPSAVFVKGLSGVVEVAAGAGGYHTCARKADGTVSCWGLNECGQLGNGAASRCENGVTFAVSVPSPVAVTGLTDAVELALGQYASCARKRDGSVVCWGSNGAGGLGNGTDVGSGVPVPVTGLTDVVELTAGSGHACARKRDGSLVCWGMNADGRLGNATTSNASTPVAVVGLEDVASVSAGNYHTCASRRDGTVWCWGSDQGPAEPDGQRADALVPTLVPEVTRVRELAAGALHDACAIRQHGNVVCWGSLWVAAGAAEPLLKVEGTRHAVELGSGEAHACALLRDRSVACWGRNPFGQLGGGPGTPQNYDVVRVPVRVTGL